MFDTFSNNYIAAEQMVDSRILRKFGKAQNSSKLWFACKRGWPLQQLAFNITVATPKKICCLENILLYIYQVMPDNPPDSKTIADELAIGDHSFVDEVVTDLIRLGALKAGQTGRIAITDLGCECHSRGQIPSKSRKQKISLCFDPVKHEFPDRLFLSESDQSRSEGDTFQSIVRDYRVADANRIDLDNIRRVAALQGMLSSEDTVIFDAEPDDEVEGGICWKGVYVFVFLDDHGQISLCVHDPQSKSVSKWFQDVINDRLKEGSIDFSYLFGPLATDTVAGIDTNGDFDGLSPIPAHQVQEKILTAVNKADEFLSIQAHGSGGNGNRHTDNLWKAIQEVAERGVRCCLLWDGTKINGNIPVHKNIVHRLASTTGYEFLIVDEYIIFAALISQVTLPSGGPAASILMVGQSKDRSVCRKFKQGFLEKCASGKLLDLTKTVVGPQGISQNDNDNKQTANKAMASTVSPEKEA